MKIVLGMICGLAAGLATIAVLRYLGVPPGVRSPIIFAVTFLTSTWIAVR